MNYPYADLIIPRLWIGDRNSAEDRHFLLTNKILVEGHIKTLVR